MQQSPGRLLAQTDTVTCQGYSSLSITCRQVMCRQLPAPLSRHSQLGPRRLTHRSVTLPSDPMAWSPAQVIPLAGVGVPEAHASMPQRSY